MRIQVGDTVRHPTLEKDLVVIGIRSNPACLMRMIVVQDSDLNVEEIEEIEFGPLED